MEKRNKNKKSGFTLVELVVVIAIIGILAAVITPRVKNATIKAKDAKAVATLDGLRTAINVYHAEKGFTLTGAALTVEDLTKVKNAGYLDSTGALDTTGTNVQVEVGVENATCASAPTVTSSGLNKKLSITVTDGINLKFNSTGSDINCKLWSEK